MSLWFMKVFIGTLYFWPESKGKLVQKHWGCGVHGTRDSYFWKVTNHRTRTWEGETPKSWDQLKGICNSVGQITSEV